MADIDRKTIGVALLGDPEAAKQCTDAQLILPCPFCGSAAKLDRVGSWEHGCRATKIYCDNFSVQNHPALEPCPMAFLQQTFNTPGKAVEAWNTRADLRAVLEKGGEQE